MAERPDRYEPPTSIWPTAQQPPGPSGPGGTCASRPSHPARMLPATARRAVETYTTAGDVVLDPMCGIGTHPRRSHPSRPPHVGVATGGTSVWWVKILTCV